jgi:hypothetical protein
MSRRSLKEFSFGYSVPSGGQRKADDGANELIEIDLYEVGPTLKGMNPATELHAVKSTAFDIHETAAEPAGTLEEQLDRRETRRLRRECDRLLLDAALGWPTDEERKALPATKPEPEPSVPTDAELRAQAAELGIRVPPPRRAPDPSGTDFDALKAAMRD